MSLQLLRAAEQLRHSARSQEQVTDVELLLQAASGMQPSNDPARLQELIRCLEMDTSDEREFEPESDAASTALQELQLLWFQQGKVEEARKSLAASGYRYTLAHDLLRYPDPPKDAVVLQSELDDDSCQYAKVVDDVLPGPMLKHLRYCFAPDSPFWGEHSYSHSPPSPYFSYLHRLDAKPSCGLEEILWSLRQLVAHFYPAVADASYVEWWAHLRPHSSGHQLHFDSDDEGRGGVRNPIVTTVLFLDGEVGGPTLITNQPFGGSTLGDKGWLVHPKTNRIVMFDAKVLHGVLPGKGHSPSVNARRTTFMAAFWKRGTIVPRPRAPGAPAGSSMPFPNISLNDELPMPEWLRMHDGVTFSSSGPSLIRLVAPVPVRRVWEDVDERRNSVRMVSVAELRSLPNYDLCFQGF